MRRRLLFIVDLKDYHRYDYSVAAKNSLKIYAADGVYHIYNRGVAKNPIFLKEEDYAVFLSYLKEYLSPPVPLTIEELRLMDYTYERKNYYLEIQLIAYCLMPNHFHLLLRQRNSRSIESFMRSLLVRYSGYFNKHYDRVGHLFQGVYRGILVDREEYFLWLSRYIHRNPLEILVKGRTLSDYPYSSYPAYLGTKKISWIDTKDTLGLAGDYHEFVEGQKDEPTDLQSYILES